MRGGREMGGGKREERDERRGVREMRGRGDSDERGQERSSGQC